MAAKMKIEVRYRWFAKLYMALVFLLSMIHVRTPGRLDRWICERSVKYRFAGGHWTPMKVDLSDVR